MGAYFQKGLHEFRQILKSRYYVDKSPLIEYINEQIGEESALICMTRPRRFGKTFAVKMLSAYYDNSCDSSALFQNLKIAQSPSYREHLNKYHVLSFSVTNFTSRIHRSKIRDSNTGKIRNVEEKDLIPLIVGDLRSELLASYPDAGDELSDLEQIIFKIWEKTGIQFVVLIDEWDAIFRECKDNITVQKDWIMLLRGLFKSDQTVAVAAAYMTGILPIKRYGTHSALTDFVEFTMLDSAPLENSFGFLEDEVENLLRGSSLSFSEVQKWYDGYRLNGAHIYNPLSVREAIRRKRVDNYWNQTESFEALRMYIDMDYEGLHSDLSQMYMNISVPLDPSAFQNDLTSIQSKSDVLTLLVHLGYLSYDRDTGMVSIPNQELHAQFKTALTNSRSKKLIQLIQKSQEVLESIWAQDEVSVAQLIEEFHDTLVVPLKYNNEDCLRSLISMALLSSADYYSCFQELPAGKGYADLLFLPLPGIAKPAILMELKWNQPIASTITQIRNRNYPQVLSNYSGDILLVGVTYRADTKKKEHVCRIQPFSIP